METAGATIKATGDCNWAGCGPPGISKDLRCGAWPQVRRHVVAELPLLMGLERQVELHLARVLLGSWHPSSVALSHLFWPAEKEPTMRRIENAAIGIVFGAVPIIACFLAGWWISIPLVPESRIWQCALAGLLLGILVDLIFLGGWVRRAYSMRAWVWKAVYLFYSVGMFGFFMGVPVFNVMLALPAGVFVGRWLAHSGADSTHMQRVARQAAVFTASILGLVCIASGSIALASRSTASDLQGMLGLPFHVTPVMVVGIILGGGAMILALDWWLTIKSVERAYRYFVARAETA
jgi:hypothetical protein